MLTKRVVQVPLLDAAQFFLNGSKMCLGCSLEACLLMEGTTAGEVPLRTSRC